MTDQTDRELLDRVIDGIKGITNSKQSEQDKGKTVDKGKPIPIPITQVPPNHVEQSPVTKTK